MACEVFTTLTSRRSSTFSAASRSRSCRISPSAFCRAMKLARRANAWLTTPATRRRRSMIAGAHSCSRVMELKGLADLMQAVHDRLVDGARLDASETRGDVTDEPLKPEALVRGRAQTGLEIEPLRDVDDGRDHAASASVDEYAQADLERDDHAVLADAANEPAGCHPPALRRILQFRPQLGVSDARLLRQQDGDRHAEQFAGSVGEDAFGLTIGTQDGALFPKDHQPVRELLESEARRTGHLVAATQGRRWTSSEEAVGCISHGI